MLESSYPVSKRLSADKIDETAIVTVVESSSLTTSASSTSSIHILDDDSLLNIFRLYRQTIFDEDKAENHRIFEGKWVRERWWYKLVHVCQRWRSLILRSASHLDLCLVCTYRTPVADMLAHFPPLPLVIDHFRKYYEEPANSEDEAGILIALQQRDRVRRIQLGGHVPYMQRLIETIDEEFPMLEYLCIMCTTVWNKWWPLPKTFQAPRLRHLILSDFAFPMRSPLLTNIDILELTLQLLDSYADFTADTLLQPLSLMHHLQSFAIDCGDCLDAHVNGEPLMIRNVTLPNLRSFAFHGECAFLEALLPHITTPLLEKLYISLFYQQVFSAPHLLQFIITTVNFTGWPSSAVLRFDDWEASVELFPDVGAQMYSVCLSNQVSTLNRQVAFAAHVLDVLRPVLSEVVHLTLEYRYGEGTAAESTLWHNQPDRTDWRKLLGAFGNVKTLCTMASSKKSLVEQWDNNQNNCISRRFHLVHNSIKKLCRPGEHLPPKTLRVGLGTARTS
ncbi:hypothetical protein BC827DRAFT_258930 [Russula dissimulans]|nr:hypothetical protein BC827DRAFT_258930 [Russula dissimulans]